MNSIVFRIKILNFESFGFFDAPNFIHMIDLPVDHNQLVMKALNLEKSSFRDPEPGFPQICLVRWDRSHPTSCEMRFG